MFPSGFSRRCPTSVLPPPSSLTNPSIPATPATPSPRFADPAASGLEPERRAAAERVARAFAAAPEMVAGPGRFTTRLMTETGGRVLGKEGADGLYAVAVRGPVALGVAVKIAGGEEDCRPGVVIDVLRQLGVLSADEFGRLEDLHTPRRRNHRGLDVGAVEPDVELQEP